MIRPARPLFANLLQIAFSSAATADESSGICPSRADHWSIVDPCAGQAGWDGRGSGGGGGGFDPAFPRLPVQVPTGQFLHKPSFILSSLKVLSPPGARIRNLLAVALPCHSFRPFGCFVPCFSLGFSLGLFRTNHVDNTSCV